MQNSSTFTTLGYSEIEPHPEPGRIYKIRHFIKDPL